MFNNEQYTVQLGTRQSITPASLPEVIPRPEVLLSATSLTLSLVIWTLLSQSSYYNSFKRPKDE
jgi:hypothetical protein